MIFEHTFSQIHVENKSKAKDTMYSREKKNKPFFGQWAAQGFKSSHSNKESKPNRVDKRSGPDCMSFLCAFQHSISTTVTYACIAWSGLHR